jgi:hypothetical protein
MPSIYPTQSQSMKLANEVGDSIKPSVLTLGQLGNKKHKAIEDSDSLYKGCRPLRRAYAVGVYDSWCLRTRLYAVTCFAGFPVRHARKPRFSPPRTTNPSQTRSTRSPCLSLLSFPHCARQMPSSNKPCSFQNISPPGLGSD